MLGGETVGVPAAGATGYRLWRCGDKGFPEPAAGRFLLTRYPGMQLDGLRETHDFQVERENEPREEMSQRGAQVINVDSSTEERQAIACRSALEFRSTRLTGEDGGSRTSAQAGRKQLARNSNSLHNKRENHSERQRLPCRFLRLPHIPLLVVAP